METISPSTDILDGDKIVSCLSKKYNEDMIPTNVFTFWKDIVPPASNRVKWLWFCLLICVIPKPNKQNQVVKVQPQGLVLVLFLAPEPEPHSVL